jgi:DNA polymerase III sliding clamp (beta) subunit (PCNA family)
VKFTINTSDFLNALALPVETAHRKSTIAVTQLLGITVMKDAPEAYRLHLRSTNLEVTTQVFAQADVVEDGAIAVNAWALYDIVKKFGAKTTVTCGEDRRLILTSGRSKITLAGVPIKDVPEPLKGENLVYVDPKALAKAMESVYHAVPRDDTRPALAGLRLELDPVGRVRTVGCDSKRLAAAEAKFDLGCTPDHPFKLTVPCRMTEQTIALFKKKDIKHPALSFGDETFLAAGKFDTFEVSLACKHNGIPFIDWAPFFKGEREHVFSFAVADLRSALGEAKTVAGELTPIVQFDVDAEEVTVSLENQRAACEVKRDCVGDPRGAFTFLVNADYLLECLAPVTSERVRFEMAAPAAPILVFPEPSCGYLGMVLALNQ